LSGYGNAGEGYQAAQGAVGLAWYGDLVWTEPQRGLCFLEYDIIIIYAGLSSP